MPALKSLPVPIQPPDGFPAHSLLPLLGRIFKEMTFRSLNKWNLQPNVCMVLGQLHVEPGVCEPAAIAHAARQPRQTTTFILDTLEKQGLALRKPHPSDRRRKIVQLTPKGHHLAKQVLADMLQVETAALDGLTGAEAQAIRTLMYRYAVALCEQNDRQP
jgi:DNA-binding MarR family transcriptional regulator